MYDPLKPPKHSRATCEKYFGRKADSRLAARLHKENPAEYRSVRASSVEHGLLGAETYLTQADVDNHPMNARQREFSTQEIRARGMYSEAEIRSLYQKSGQAGDQHNLANIQRDKPELYALIKIAAQSYGIIPPTSATPAPRRLTPTPEAPGMFTLSPEIARELNMPEGHRVNEKTFADLLRIKQELQEAKAQIDPAVNE